MPGTPFRLASKMGWRCTAGMLAMLPGLPLLHARGRPWFAAHREWLLAGTWTCVTFWQSCVVDNYMVKAEGREERGGEGRAGQKSRTSEGACADGRSCPAVPPHLLLFCPHALACAAAHHGPAGLHQPALPPVLWLAHCRLPRLPDAPPLAGRRRGAGVRRQHAAAALHLRPALRRAPRSALRPAGPAPRLPAR